MTFFEKRAYYRLIFVLLMFALVILMIFAATIGAANISFSQAINILLSKLPLIRNIISCGYIDNTHAIIVLNLRLPRIILAALAGAGLSIVGAVFQGIFRNPMADPYVLGISSGASAGAALAIAAGAEYIFMGFGLVTISSFIGALFSIIVVYSVARVGTKVPTTTLLLSGIAMNFLLSSVVSLIMFFNRNRLDRIVFWMMGSFAASDMKRILLLFPLLIGSTLLIYSYSRDLNIISTGEDIAKSLGIEVEKTKKILIALCSAIVASCVAVSGVIGFAGLIIPHIVRMMFGSDNRVLIPFSMIVGAIFMVVCDTIARIAMPPLEIPVGAITSIFGAPYFIFLLQKYKRKEL